MEPTLKRSTVDIIFFSPSEHRLRAGWRILLQVFMMVVFLVVVSFPVLWFSAGKSQTWLMFYSTLAECFAITVSIIYARRFIDKRTFISLGFVVSKKASLDIVSGIVISFLMMGVIFIFGLTAKWIKFDNFAWQTDGLLNSLDQFLIWLLIFILVAWQEELLSRGYFLQNFKDGINFFWAIIISSLIFAFLHIFNPGANWVSTLGIFLAGLFLAFGYVTTKQLWLPIGLHLGWNLFEGVIFGFPVSGLNTYALIRIHVSGPPLWTGGPFGPEAGLVILPALLLGSLLVYVYARYLRGKNG
jgi:membrane protease YdiL (CAAX protease family)